MNTTPPFCRAELERALGEQRRLAVAAFTITQADNLQATATVKLLSGSVIRVQLTHQGFSLLSGAPPQPGPVHESIEGLLESVSPDYAKRRADALIAALGDIS